MLVMTLYCGHSVPVQMAMEVIKLLPAVVARAPVVEHQQAASAVEHRQAVPAAEPQRVARVAAQPRVVPVAVQAMAILFQNQVF